MSDYIKRVDLQKVIDKLQRRAVRQDNIARLLAADHAGEETTTFNYYAGQSKGYHSGMSDGVDNAIGMLENLLEDK